MNIKRDWKSVRMPKRLHVRPRDTRGIPIPFIAFVDANGVPQFTINDEHRTRQCRTKRLCGICGKRFDEFGMWFVGGARCFTHDAGAFIDPPMHWACAAYAMQVCPFLAAPRYSKRIDDAKLTAGGIDTTTAILVRNGMPEEQPELFGLGGTLAYRWLEDHRVYRIDEWVHIEWWRNGVEVDAPDEMPT